MILLITTTSYHYCNHSMLFAVVLCPRFPRLLDAAGSGRGGSCRMTAAKGGTLEPDADGAARLTCSPYGYGWSRSRTGASSPWRPQSSMECI